MIQSKTTKNLGSLNYELEHLNTQLSLSNPLDSQWAQCFSWFSIGVCILIFIDGRLINALVFYFHYFLISSSSTVIMPFLWIDMNLLKISYNFAKFVWSIPTVYWVKCNVNNFWLKEHQIIKWSLLCYKGNENKDTKIRKRFDRRNEYAKT